MFRIRKFTPYQTKAVTFDGTNDYMLRGSDLTGSVNGKKGMFSCWVRINGGNGARQRILVNEGGFFGVDRSTTDKFALLAFDSGSGVVVTAETSATHQTSATWKHVLMSWDAGVSRAQIYINNVSDVTGAAFGSNDINYTRTNWAIGALADGTLKCNMDFADLYFTLAESFDLTDATFRGRFIDVYGKPVDLGDGRQPTGTQPAIYVRGPLGDFPTNIGNGGNFTVTGALTDSATPP